MAEVRIGISGWTYAPWRGTFYPKKLPQKQELGYASSILRAIEVNGTFYGLQRPDAFGSWYDQTPEGFIFSIKAPRFITHIRRAKDVEIPVANFLASGVLRLGTKLGPILWQFPPSFRFDPGLMDTFLALLPHDTKSAAACARQHDHRLDGRDWVEPVTEQPLRHAIEVRHESFRDPVFIELLRKHDVALVCADTVEWPRLMDLTSDFMYCRLHGSEELYRSAYSDDALDRWAARISAWSGGKAMHDGEFVSDKQGKAMRRDVFLFFDNTDKLQAPHDAQALMRKLGQAPEETAHHQAYAEIAKDVRERPREPS